jgi:hypothetical protein
MDNKDNEYEYETEELTEAEDNELETEEDSLEVEETEEVGEVTEEVPVVKNEAEEDDDDDEDLKKEKRTIIMICVIVGMSLIILTLIIALMLKRPSKSNNVSSTDTTSETTSNKVSNTIKIIFDSAGGQPVDTMEIEEGTSITLPTTTKTGYKLDGWYLEEQKVDANTTFDKDTVLVAKWVKEEYTCPNGYTLKDKTCTLTINATAACPNGTKENGEYCVSLTDYKKATKKCKKTTLDGVEYEGTIFEREDETVCAYAPVDNITTDTECGAQGNKWMVNKCYKHTVTNSNDYSVSCDKEYNYLSKDDLKTKFNITNMVEGCYKQSNKTYSCEKDFTLKDKTCTKTVEATIKE